MKIDRRQTQTDNLINRRKVSRCGEIYTEADR